MEGMKINGVLHVRSAPTEQWRPLTPEELTDIAFGMMEALAEWEGAEVNVLDFLPT